MKPSASTLPSSSLLVATVVPCETAVMSLPPAPTMSRIFSIPAMNPSAGLPGVLGVFVVTSSPESSSKATTSVNVPRPFGRTGYQAPLRSRLFLPAAVAVEDAGQHLVEGEPRALGAQLLEPF